MGEEMVSSTSTNTDGKEQTMGGFSEWGTGVCTISGSLVGLELAIFVNHLRVLKGYFKTSKKI